MIFPPASFRPVNRHYYLYYTALWPGITMPCGKKRYLRWKNGASIKRPSVFRGNEKIAFLADFTVRNAILRAMFAQKGIFAACRPFTR
jgi:hypothetical protein